ncbi:MAG TPA: hypothetical protein VJ739_06950 [Gemmataceae bacterium]|nr:hypothetical protein [Gemmataceae bacterium]
MPIPDLNADGFLPAEIFDCTLEEMTERFGQDCWVDNRLRQCRSRLFARLCSYLGEVRRAGIPGALLVDGSFTTSKAEPEDIDLALVLPAGHDFAQELRPIVYNLVSKRRVRQGGYPFDLFVVAEGSLAYQEVVKLFHRVKDHPELAKGFLRVRP